MAPTAAGGPACTLTAKVADVLPQVLLAVTVTVYVPEFVQVTVALVVPCPPVTLPPPTGTAQVYDVAPLTALIEYACAPGHGLFEPVILPTAEGG